MDHNHVLYCFLFVSLPDEVYHLAEIRLLLTGWFLSGKTTIVDTVLGIHLGERRRTLHSEARQSQVGRWKVRLIDTPGWSKLSSIKDTPEMVKQEIARGVSLCTPGPHAIILVVTAAVAFNKAHLRSIREHMSLLGPDVWRHTLVLFSWGECMGRTTMEQFIESEGTALQLLLRKCNNRYHRFNIHANDPAQASKLLEKIEWMVAENSIFRLNGNESDKWEEDETVTETMSPPGGSLLEMFEDFCKNKEEELLMNHRILFSQEMARSMSELPYSKYFISSENMFT